MKYFKYINLFDFAGDVDDEYPFFQVSMAVSILFGLLNIIIIGILILSTDSDPYSLQKLNSPLNLWFVIIGIIIPAFSFLFLLFRYSFFSFYNYSLRKLRLCVYLCLFGLSVWFVFGVLFNMSSETTKLKLFFVSFLFFVLPTISMLIGEISIRFIANLLSYPFRYMKIKRLFESGNCFKKQTIFFCFICKENIDISKLKHDWHDGKCYRCGAIQDEQC